MVPEFVKQFEKNDEVLIHFVSEGIDRWCVVEVVCAEFMFTPVIYVDYIKDNKKINQRLPFDEYNKSWFAYDSVTKNKEI